MSSYVPPLFADIGKKSKDLFKNKYNFDNSLVVKHRDQRTRDCSLSIESRANAGDCCGIYGETKLTLENTKGTQHKIVVDGSSLGKVGGSVEFKNLAPNLTVKLCGGVDQTGAAKACDSKEECSVNSCLKKLNGGASAQYRRESFAGSVGLCHKPGKTCVNASAVVGNGGLSAGGSVSADAAAGAIACYAAGVQYEHSDIVLALTSENKFRSHSISAYHPVNKDTTVAFNFVFNCDEKCAKKQRVLYAGVEYAAAADTTIKAKASSAGCSALSVEHRLANPNLLIGFSAGFNWNKTSGGCAVADKFGVQVTLGDI